MNDRTRDPTKADSSEVNPKGDWSELNTLLYNLDGVLEDTAACGGTAEEYDAIEQLSAAVEQKDLPTLIKLSEGAKIGPYTKELRAWVEARQTRQRLLQILSQFGKDPNRPDEQP